MAGITICPLLFISRVAVFAFLTGWRLHLFSFPLSVLFCFLLTSSICVTPFLNFFVYSCRNVQHSMLYNISLRCLFRFNHNLLPCGSASGRLVGTLRKKKKGRVLAFIEKSFIETRKIVTRTSESCSQNSTLASCRALLSERKAVRAERGRSGS